jgi:hypothetical protein
MWILIVLMATTGAAASSLQTEFVTEKNCRDAVEKLTHKYEFTGFRADIKAFCFYRG